MFNLFFNIECYCDLDSVFRKGKKYGNFIGIISFWGEILVVLNICSKIFVIKSFFC